MYRKLTILITLLIMLLAVSAVYAQDDDNEADDSTILTVERIESETIVLGEMETIGSPRLYVFIGSEGDEVTISMVADDPNELDPYLVLLGAAGEVFAANDDMSDSDFSAQIDDFELPYDGAYFVLATTFNDLVQGGLNPDEVDDNGPLAYEIGLTGATIPPDHEDEEEFEYFNVPVELGDRMLLEISPDEPVVYVVFIAEEGQVIDIATSENGGDFVNTMLYLFDRSGSRLAVSSGGPTEDDFYAVISNFEVPEDGLYLIFATASNFYQATEASWQGYGAFVFSIE